MKLTAIVPKPVFNTSVIQQRAQAQLQRDSLDVVNKIADYPSQEETTYVRSGNLGRNWRLEPQGPGEIWIVNRVESTVSRYRTKTKGIVARRHAPRNYSIYVQGSKKTDPGQARIMEEKGWQTIDEVADEVFGDRAGVYTKLLAGG